MFKTERLPADAGRISDVIFQVLKYNVFGDGAVPSLLLPLHLAAIRCGLNEGPLWRH